MGKKKTAAEKIMTMAQKDRANSDCDCGMVDTVNTNGVQSLICVQDKYLSTRTFLHGCEEAPTVERKTLDDGTVYYVVAAETRRADGTLIRSELTAFMKK